MLLSSSLIRRCFHVGGCLLSLVQTTWKGCFRALLLPPVVTSGLLKVSQFISYLRTKNQKSSNQTSGSFNNSIIGRSHGDLVKYDELDALARCGPKQIMTRLNS